MAKDKKSVLLYCDIIHTVEELDDVDAGLLFKHYLRYINDQNPEPPSRLIKIVFEPIKQNLKRDLKKWEQKSERNSLIAKEGWIKRKDANAYERTEHYANHADKDTVTVNVTDTVKENVNVKEDKMSVAAAASQTIDDRANLFMQKVATYLHTYSKEMLREFYDYWTEKNEGGKKMRFEMQKVFDISKRLQTWKRNERTGKKQVAGDYSTDRLAEVLRERGHIAGD